MMWYGMYVLFDSFWCSEMYDSSPLPSEAQACNLNPAQLQVQDLTRNEVDAFLAYLSVNLFFLARFANRP